MADAFPQPSQDADSRGFGSTARAGWPTTGIRWSRRGWRPAPPRPTSAYVWSGGGAWAFAPWTSLFDSPWASDIRVAYGPFHDFPAGLRGASIRPYRPASGQRGDHTARLAFVSVRAGATLSLGITGVGPQEKFPFSTAPSLDVWEKNFPACRDDERSRRRRNRRKVLNLAARASTDLQARRTKM